MSTTKSATITTHDTPPKWLVIMQYHPSGYQAVITTIEFDDEIAARNAAREIKAQWSFTDCIVVPKGTVIR